MWDDDTQEVRKIWEFGNQLDLYAEIEDEVSQKNLQTSIEAQER